MKQTVDKRVRKGTTINCVLRVLEDVIALFVGEKEREREESDVLFTSVLSWEYVEENVYASVLGVFIRMSVVICTGFLFAFSSSALPPISWDWVRLQCSFFFFFLNPVVMQPLLLPTLVRKCNVDQSIGHQVNNQVQLMTKKEWNKNVGIQAAGVWRPLLWHIFSFFHAGSQQVNL